MQFRNLHPLVLEFGIWDETISFRRELPARSTTSPNPIGEIGIYKVLPRRECANWVPVQKFFSIHVRAVVIEPTVLDACSHRQKLSNCDSGSRIGANVDPLTAAEELLEIIMRRYERASTMLTSNRPVEDWGKLLGDAAAVSAMLDRLLHHGHVLKCGPRSWRTKMDAPGQ